MANKIQLMDSQLSNMIAAGEVVERPASAVKELVENAIDAGATKIEIHLLDSGLRQIKIVDNGSGMSQSDAKLAFLRHATSKIKTKQDIMRISTLGFRGEALPSIAAVSDVHLKTSDGEGEGFYLNIKGGKEILGQPYSMRRGTEVEVNHLFFNTPARLKHMKSLNTELSHITEYLTKTALANPQMSLTVVNNQKEIFRTPGRTNVQTVLSRIYGFDVAKKMHEISGGDADFKISGLISAPDVTRASRNYITFIVNSRPIKNFELTRAVIEAYHTYLPKDRYPIAVIHLEVDYSLVDVNVHPAKIEVRFSKEEALKSFILTAIQKTLKSLTHIPEPTLTPRPAVTEKREQGSLFTTGNKQSLARFNKPREYDVPKSDGFEIGEQPVSYGSTPISKPKFETSIERVAESEAQAPIVQVPVAKEKPALELHYIGQLHGTYLLAQNEEGLYLIDQHAAAERVAYEKNYELLGAPSTESMELLAPITMSYPVAEVVKITAKLSELTELGFEIEAFGSSDLIIRKVPTWAAEQALRIVETMINTLLAEGEISLAKLREQMAIMISCRSSIKANQYMNDAEVRGLLADLCACEQPFTCPHGRPVIVKMTTYEIEKLFKRA